MPRKKRHKQKSGHLPHPLVLYHWENAELLALARKAFNYQWSLDHETSPRIEITNDYLGFQKTVESVSWKLGLAQYHEFEAIHAIPQIVGDVPDPAAAAGALMMASMSGHEEAEPFEDAMLMAEAHTLAAAQAFHSTMDILANVLYIGLGLYSIKAISERERGLRKIAQILQSKDKDLASALDSVLTSEAFRYLSAFVNTTKHRRLIERHFTVALDESQKFGLRFVPFKFEFGDNVQILPSKWMEDFLRESAKLVSDTIALVAKEVATSLDEQVKSIKPT